MRNYGLPYMGSKSKIAGRIFGLFPTAENFYDLFCGGCAMTHYALLHKNYKNIFANDIDVLAPTLFDQAIHGKFKNEKRWISREDFFVLKDKDPYVKFCWSFGNAGLAYLYAKEIEPWKKALHYARVLGDFSLLEEFGIKTDSADRITVAKNKSEWKEKYAIWYCKNILHTSLDTLELQKKLTERIEHNNKELRNYLLEGLRKAGKRPCDVDRYLGTNGMAGHYFGKSQWEFPTRENYKKLQNFLYLPLDYEDVYGLASFLEAVQSLQSLESLESLERLERLESLESLERLERLESLERLQSLKRLYFSFGDYSDVKIKKNSVIYCDIPYAGAAEYSSGAFDYERFYAWCEKQTEPLFVSSYALPKDRFVCVDKITNFCTLSAVASNKVVEKVFIPKSQAQSYRVPGELFNFDEW